MGPESPEGIRIHERSSGERRILFLLNYTGGIETISLSGSWQDALSGESGSTFSIRPVDARVLIQDMV